MSPKEKAAYVASKHKWTKRAVQGTCDEIRLIEQKIKNEMSYPKDLRRVDTLLQMFSFRSYMKELLRLTATC